MVRFIHTADLQLGMTRRFLDEDAQARYAQARGWKIEVIDQHETGVGGFKEIKFEIRGSGAFSRGSARV